MEVIAVWLVRLVGWYLMVGFIFGLFFVTVWAGRMDPSTRQTGWGFKLIILPGVATLWPVLAFRLLKHQTHPPEECSAHRRAAQKDSYDS